MRYLQSFQFLEDVWIDKASLLSTRPHRDEERRINTNSLLKSLNTIHDTNHTHPQSNFSHDSYKPFFVMHIGPVKTGTTTLQCALQSLSPSLRKDGFVVAETESCRPDINETALPSNLTWTKGGVATYDNVVLGKSFAPNCLGQWNESATGMPDCWTASYGKFAREEAQQNHSILISNEIIPQVTSKFSEKFVHDLVESLPDFRLVVVVTHRPWFEWVASLQDQMTKNFLNRPRDWPGRGTRVRKMESLQNFIARQLKYRRRRKNKRSSQTYPFVDDAIHIFRNHSQVELKIVDIHEKGDFVTNVVCKKLVGATKTCNSLKSDNGMLGDKNKAENKLWYDMLAVEAHNQGLVSRSRLQAYKRIQEFQESKLNKTSTDFPKMCPPKSFLERIWKESIWTEKRVWSNQQHRKVERRHRAAFDRAVEANKFCTINATTVLEDERWLDFFKSMKRQKKTAS